MRARAATANESLSPPSGPSNIVAIQFHSTHATTRTYATRDPVAESMAGGTTVCSMCGDVGFPDKLFRCARCRRRFQHSYCTNYYGEVGAGVCDWCLSDDVGGGGKKRQYSSASSGYSKQQQQQEEEVVEEAAGRVINRSAQQQPASFPPSGCSKGAGKVAGSEHEGGRRPRRYKLLKDVLC